MTLKKLARISCKASLLFLVGCGLPKVTLHQLDTKHNQANPFKITNYNEDTCKLEVEEQTSFPILGPELHGGFCVTAEDFTKIKTHMESECKNKKINKEKNNK